MKTAVAALGVVLLVLVSTPAPAHEGGVHVMGTVVSIDDSALVVKDQHGAQKSVALTGDTKFEKDEAPAARGDVHPGDRVVVHARKEGERLVATEVRFTHPGSPGRK